MNRLPRGERILHNCGKAPSLVHFFTRLIMARQRRRPKELRSHRGCGAQDLRAFDALYPQHIIQANDGCDFDFLHTGAPTPDPEIH